MAYGHFDPLGDVPPGHEIPKKEARVPQGVYVIAFIVVMALVLIGVMYALPLLVE